MRATPQLVVNFGLELPELRHFRGQQKLLVHINALEIQVEHALRKLVVYFFGLVMGHAQTLQHGTEHHLVARRRALHEGVRGQPQHGQQGSRV